MPSKLEARDQFAKLARSKGWAVAAAWPTFFLIRGDKVCAVEPVRSADTSLPKDQVSVMEELADRGVPCYLWSPDGGYVAVHGEGGDRGGVGEAGEEKTPQQTTLLQEGESEGEPLDGVRRVECPECGAAPGASCVSNNGRPRKANHIERVRASRGEEVGSTIREQIDRVWAHYVAVMKPRQQIAGKDDRALIRAALDVATADELCEAIDHCAASAFHMGKNDRSKKYNKLSNIIKGKRGGKTTREQIDMFLDLSPEGEDRQAGSDAVNIRKKAVLRMPTYPDNLAIQETGRKAIEWLQRHGFEVIRDGDNFTFRRTP